MFFATGDKKKLNEYIMKSFRFIFFTLDRVLGIITISKEFVPIFLGGGYETASTIINGLAPMILFCGITNVIGTQYLLPTKRQKEYTISILIGLIVNIIFNLILIPIWGAFGAGIVTTLSQLIVAIVQSHYVKNEINILYAFRSGEKIFNCINSNVYNMHDIRAIYTRWSNFNYY